MLCGTDNPEMMPDAATSLSPEISSFSSSLAIPGEASWRRAASGWREVEKV